MSNFSESQKRNYLEWYTIGADARRLDAMYIFQNMHPTQLPSFFEKRGIVSGAQASMLNIYLRRAFPQQDSMAPQTIGEIEGFVRRMRVYADLRTSEPGVGTLLLGLFDGLYGIQRLNNPDK